MPSPNVATRAASHRMPASASSRHGVERLRITQVAGTPYLISHTPCQSCLPSNGVVARCLTSVPSLVYQGGHCLGAMGSASPQTHTSMVALERGSKRGSVISSGRQHHLTRKS